MKQTLNSVVIFRDGSGRCSSRAVAMRLDSPQPSAAAPIQPWLRVGAGMRPLTNAPIVVAGVVVGGPLAGRANGRVARVGDTVSPEWQACVEVSPPRRRVFARGPVRLSTDQGRHPRFASRTDFAGQSGGSSGGSRVGGRCPAPERASVCVWACGLARLASPDSAVAAALCSEAAVPLATYGCEEFGSS
jgi:hypothetical protein